jgi:hypothetical protein
MTLSKISLLYILVLFGMVSLIKKNIFPQKMFKLILIILKYGVFVLNLVKHWLSIPRWIKQGILTSIVLYHLIIWFLHGLNGVKNLFKFPSTFFTHTNLVQFVLCLIITTLLFYLFKRKPTETN